MTLKQAGRNPAKYEYEDGNFYAAWTIPTGADEDKIVATMRRIIDFIENRGAPEGLPKEDKPAEHAWDEVFVPLNEPTEELEDIPGVSWAEFNANPRELGLPQMPEEAE